MSESQFSTPAKNRKVGLSKAQEFQREEERLDRRAPRVKRAPRKNWYEELLDQHGIKGDR